MKGKTLSLKGRALKYLAAREHSRVELTRKLTPHAESAEEVARVLDELESRGFLSAQRFAESVVHRKAARYGVARLKSELHQHQLPDEVTREVTQVLRETELERAQVLWQKKFGQVAETPAELAKQMRFLAGRGFSGDVIRRVVKGQFDVD